MKIGANCAGETLGRGNSANLRLFPSSIRAPLRDTNYQIVSGKQRVYQRADMHPWVPPPVGKGILTYSLINIDLTLRL